jgi:hypothetical protein
MKKREGDRDWMWKRRCMRKDCMQHQRLDLMERVVGFGFFSTRFGRCRSCRVRMSEFRVFSFISLWPLWKVQWWGRRACGAPHWGILCRAQRLALPIKPLSSPLYSIFFSLFSLGPLASLLTLVLHGGIPRHKYKRARRALARDSSTFNKGGRRNCRVLSLFSLKSSTCALYINLKLIHYKEYAW